MNYSTPVAGVYRIELPTPYPVGPVNCYLLDGPEPVLVDCGPDTLEAQAALRVGLAALNRQVRDITSILLTHHHADHTGGLRWLRTETAAPVLGHPFCDLWLLNDPSIVETRRQFFMELYSYCGVEGNTNDLLSRRFSEYAFLEGAPVVEVPLADGTSQELAGSIWEVLWTPGHAGTHLGLLRADGAFLGGDTILERISSNALLEPPYPGEIGRQPSLLAYRRTLQGLVDLSLGVILPGHGASFSGADSLLLRRLNAQEARARRLLVHLRSAPATVLALSELLFPGLAADQLFLGLSEVLGHLDLLEEQGLAQHTEGVPALYSATSLGSTT